MSAYRFVTITCDECGEIWDSGFFTRVVAARKSARGEGWRFDRRGDTCPLHNGFVRAPLGDGYEPADTKDDQ